MIVPGKGSVALLASALPTLFPSAHAARGGIGVVSSMPHDEQLRVLTTTTPGLGWIVPAPPFLYITAAAVRLASRHRGHGQHTAAWAEAGSDKSTEERMHLHSSPRTASSVRSRPKSRRRSHAPLHVAGVEGPSASAGAAAGAAAASAAAESPVAAAATPTTAASAATATTPTASVVAAAGVDRTQQDSREVTSSSSTRTNGVGGGVGSKAAASLGGEEAHDYFSATATAMAAIVTAATLDEGEATSRQLEGAISRQLEVEGRSVRLRVATLDDFSAIADVRFDVFSPVHSNLKTRFRKRSCVLMKERRRKGAFCLVAALEGDGEPGGRSGKPDGGRGGSLKGEAATAKKAVPVEAVLGTLECSRHEFDLTPLEIEREEGTEAIARLYLTEVAVRSDSRNLGLGSALLGLVDDVAEQLETYEVYLHVNEINEAGLRLYKRCGYTEAPNCASNRAFTNSLGLAEGFIGQRHLLLCKTYRTGDPASASPPSAPAA